MLSPQSSSLIPHTSPTGARVAVLSVFLLLGAALSALLSLLVPPLSSRDDMPGGSYHSEGIFNPRPTVYGLSDPETMPDGTTIQRTTSHATLTFPYLAHLGQYTDVSLRLASAQAAGQPSTTVTISLNRVSYPPFQVSNKASIYTFSLDTRQSPNPYLDPAHVQLDITNTTALAPDGRNLGVAIDWISATPRRGPRDILFSLAAWLASLLLVLLVALRRLSLRWAICYASAALLTFIIVTLTYTVRPFPPSYELGLAAVAWAFAAALAPPRRPIWGLALAAICLWVALAGRWLVDWQMDDAYISYRYASNLVHGHGLVYNPGEPVEGYTNFLWTLIAALFIALGFHPGGVMLALVVLFSLALVALAFHLGSRLSGGTYPWPILSAGLLALDPSFVTYGLKGSGIEAVPFAFLVLLPVALLWSHSHTPAQESQVTPSTPRRYLIAAGVTLALASLMRPEGMAIAALLIAVKLYQIWREKRRVGPLLASLALPYLLILLPYQAWRISFYGYPFPNTFYAKTGLSLALLLRGWTYTWDFMADHWLPVSLTALGLLLVPLSALFNRIHPNGTADHQTSLSHARWITPALALTVSLFTLYIISVGGDHFPEGRFFVPLVAPLVLLAQFASQKILTLLPTTRRLRSFANLLLALALSTYVVSALSLQDPQGPLSKRTARDTNFVNIWGSAGLWLRDNTSPDIRGASPVAGAIAYYSRRNIVDMLGVTDLHIGHKQVDSIGTGLAGHEKEDPQYVLARQPNYILPYPNYFDPVADSFTSQYMTTTVRGPLGLDIEWWRRRTPTQK